MVNNLRFQLGDTVAVYGVVQGIHINEFGRLCYIITISHTDGEETTTLFQIDPDSVITVF